MKAANQAAKDVDAYIAGSPDEVQRLLKRLRAAIRKAAPTATEAMSYGIPTFKLNGNLVHFAAYKHHIGFYPGASGIEEFDEELAGYELSKGTVRFPLDAPLPLDLVARIVKFRVQENLAERRRKG